MFSKILLIEIQQFHISKVEDTNNIKKDESYSDDEENQGDLSEGSIKEYEKKKSYLFDNGNRSPESSAENLDDLMFIDDGIC